MRVVLTEKPSVAEEIAKVLISKSVKRENGYYTGNNYIITYAFGHLIRLANPEKYTGSDKWNLNELPILPDKFHLIVNDDSGIRKQLKVIKECFENASEIIVATDAGREGELIFRYIYDYLGCNKKFSRLWISSLTKKAIEEGFNNLLPGNKFDSLYEAAKARSEADWLVGINATRALSLTANTGIVWSIGRVQTPTLAMVVSRYYDNINFKPELYYEIQVEGVKDNVAFIGKSDKYKANELDIVKKLVKQIGEKNTVVVKEIEKKELTEPTPLLYDLTTLQQDANKKYSMTAAQTLQTAQKLYESKYITYPRTSSRYIGDDIFEKVPELLKGFITNQQYGSSALVLTRKESLNKRSVDSSKVTDHHAIIPTEEHPDIWKLTDMEKNIYNLVLSRLLESFHDSCKKEVTTLVTHQIIDFTTKGLVFKEAGWRSVRREQDDSDEDFRIIPKVAVNDIIQLNSVQELEKTTKPLPLHTEATLLKAMKNCGRDIEDEEALEVMKEAGIGTPATRDQIIENLLEKEYMIRKGKSLIPTKKGEKLYELVKDNKISKPILTGDWEKMLSRIEKQSLSYSEFNLMIKNYTISLTKELTTIEKSKIEVSETNGVHCPNCKKQMTINKFGAFCSDKENCGFKIWRTISSKELSDNHIISLLTKRKTGVIKGFISNKTGKSYEAILTLDKDKELDKYKVNFQFENTSKNNGHGQVAGKKKEVKN